MSQQLKKKQNSGKTGTGSIPVPYTVKYSVWYYGITDSFVLQVKSDKFINSKGHFRILPEF